MAFIPISPVFFMVLVIYAAIYKQMVVNKYPQDLGEGEEVADSECGEFRESEYGLFSMFKDPPTALWACFCTPVLAAKNYEVSHVLGFWPSCLVIGATMYSPFYFVAAVIRTILSAKLKRKLRLEPKFGKDLCLSFFCFPCEVGRESLEVDDAEHVEVTCPFKVELTPAPFRELEVEKVVEQLPGLEDDGGRNCSVLPKSRGCTVWGTTEAAAEAEEAAEERTSWFTWGGKAVDEGEEVEEQEQRSWFAWRSSAVAEAENEIKEVTEELAEPPQQEADMAGRGWFTWRTSPEAGKEEEANAAE